MFRSVMVTILFLILSTSASAQEVVQGRRSTHEVVKGETLWSLAERYLGNPYRWPLIYEANSSQIQNPNLIEPGQLLVIPGEGLSAAQVQGVAVITQGEVVVAEENVVALPAGGVWAQTGGATNAPCPAPGDRTLFFSGRVPSPSCPTIAPSSEERSSFYTPPPELRLAEGMASEAPTAGSVSLAGGQRPRGSFGAGLRLRLVGGTGRGGRVHRHPERVLPCPCRSCSPGSRQVGGDGS